MVLPKGFSIVVSALAMQLLEVSWISLDAEGIALSDSILVSASICGCSVGISIWHVLRPLLDNLLVIRQHYNCHCPSCTGVMNSVLLFNLLNEVLMMLTCV